MSGGAPVMGPMGPQGPQEGRGHPHLGPCGPKGPSSTKSHASENNKSGLNGVAMPPLGLILSGSTATDSGVPLGALGGLQTAKNLPETLIFMFFGSLGGPPSLLGMPIVPLRDAHCRCHSIVPFVGCRYVDKRRMQGCIDKCHTTIRETTRGFPAKGEKGFAAQRDGAKQKGNTA